MKLVTIWEKPRDLRSCRCHFSVSFTISFRDLFSVNPWENSIKQNPNSSSAIPIPAITKVQFGRPPKQILFENHSQKVSGWKKFTEEKFRQQLYEIIFVVKKLFETHSKFFLQQSKIF